MRTKRQTKRRVAIGLIAAGAAMALGAPSAVAGTYEVVSCEAAEGGGSPAWSFQMTDPARMAAAAECPRKGDIRRGIVARTRSDKGRALEGQQAKAVFKAPEGTLIRHLEAEVDGYREELGWEAGLYSSDGQRLKGCGSDTAPACSFGNPRIRQHFDLNDRSVYAMVRCDSPAGCRSAQTPHGGEPLQARVRLGAVIVTLEDLSAPALTLKGGSALSGTWQRAGVLAAFSASDNSGIQRSRMLVDGRSVAAAERDCDFRLARPCEDEPGRSLQFDTRSLSDGAHTVEVETFDAAQNRGVQQRALLVDNTAPTTVSDLAVEGGEAPRRSPQFTIGWSPFSDGGAPISKVHLRRCAGGGCETQTIANPDASRTTVSVPTGGEHELRIALEDEAGNVAEWSNAVELAYDARDEADLRLERQGQLVKGVLSGEGEQLAGRRVVIERQPMASGFKVSREASISTDGSGHFNYRIPKGPSRRLHFSFEGDERNLAASSSVVVKTAARSSLRVSHSNARNGERIRFSGKVASPVGKGGKLVALQYRRGTDAWRTFKTTRSGAGGRWAAPYRFQNTSATQTYRFRAKLPVEASYPYRLGYSRELRLRVEGRKR